MKNYRYVSQDEFFITHDINTVLITSGMTECLAISFVDKKNLTLRLLAHFDGMILYDEEIALANATKLKKAFLEAGSVCFDIFVLGGQKNRRNCKILLDAFKKLNLEITKFEDSNEFCNRLNANENGQENSFTPMNAMITMICPSEDLPQFLSYSSKKLNNISQDDLIAGMGLLNLDERENYVSFVKINEKILIHHPDKAKKMRECGNKELIKEIESSNGINSLLKLSLTKSFENANVEKIKNSFNNNNDDNFSIFEYMANN